MSTNYITKNIRIKDSDKYKTIPDNAIAKLMYYLYCVSSVIDIIDPILTDYQNYEKLTSEQLMKVYNKATEYSPDIFLSHKIFIINRDLLNDSLDNKFYEITDKSIGNHANKEISIRGRVIKVNKIMFCNNNWLSIYYYSPISVVDKIVYDIKSREKRNYQSQIVKTESSFYPSEKSPIIVPVELESKPVVMICANCQVPIKSRTESKWNYISCVFCFFCGFCYFIIQAIRKRNILCFDVTHRCPRCGAILGVYKSC